MQESFDELRAALVALLGSLKAISVTEWLVTAFCGLFASAVVMLMFSPDSFAGLLFLAGALQTALTLLVVFGVKGFMKL